MRHFKALCLVLKLLKKFTSNRTTEKTIFTFYLLFINPHYRMICDLIVLLFGGFILYICMYLFNVIKVYYEQQRILIANTWTQLLVSQVTYFKHFKHVIHFVSFRRRLYDIMLRPLIT